MKRPYRPYEKRPPTLADRQQSEIMGAAGKALIEALRSLLDVNRDRLIRTLKPYEIEMLTSETVSAFIFKREEVQMREDIMNDLKTPAPLAA